jgi:hypothetical protein
VRSGNCEPKIRSKRESICPWRGHHNLIVNFSRKTIDRKLMLIIPPVFPRLLQRLPTFRHFLMQALQLLLLLRSKLRRAFAVSSAESWKNRNQFLLSQCGAGQICKNTKSNETQAERSGHDLWIGASQVVRVVL